MTKARLEQQPTPCLFSLANVLPSLGPREILDLALVDGLVVAGFSVYSRRKPSPLGCTLLGFYSPLPGPMRFSFSFLSASYLTLHTGTPQYALRSLSYL